MAETPQAEAGSPRSPEKWLTRAAYFLLAIAVVAAAIWYLLPYFVAPHLRKALGARSYTQVLSEAEKDNATALSRLQPRVLVDVPSESIIALVRSELVKSASKLKPAEGASIELAGEPSISLLGHALRAASRGRIRHPEWGEIDLMLQIDAVPKVRDGSIVITPVITHAELRSISPFGFRLPSVATSLIEKITLDSLDALNGRFAPVVLPLKIPDRVAAAVGGSAALLVTDKSIAALLGTDGLSKGHAGADYAGRFAEAARSVLAGYEPGQGVIAFASGDRTQGGSLVDASNALRDQAVAENLAAIERTLRITSDTEPASLTETAFASTTLLSVSPAWFARQIKEKIFAAASGLAPDGVKLSIDPDDVAVELLEGVIEATVSGSAAFENDILKVDFTLTAWAAVHPDAGGVVARYVPRRVEIRRVLVGWEGREATIAVPYSDALGGVLNRIIGELPKYPVAIPPVPLRFKVPKSDAFKLVLRETASQVQLLGRSFVLSPRRIYVLSAIALSSTPEQKYPDAKPAAGQFERLEALAERGEALLRADDDVRDTASLFIGKPGLASLMNNLWETLDPQIKGDHRSEARFDAGEINLIPPDASCGNACQVASRCENLSDCNTNVCGNVVIRVCKEVCREPVLRKFCERQCHNKAKEWCRTDVDSLCVNRINTCISGAAECVARWTSGAQAKCETALAGINATNFRGLAKVSGSIVVDGSGQSFPGARLDVAPDLGRADLAVRIAGRADVEAQVNVVFTDFGNLFLCPSGRLSAKPRFAGSLADQKLSAAVAWTGGGVEPLKATITPASPTIRISSGEPPIVALARSNPGLLLCGPAQPVAGAIAGLSIVAAPRITRDLLARSIRQAFPTDKGALAAALFDGLYLYKVPIGPAEFSVPPVPVEVLSSSMTLSPRMTRNAVVLGGGGQ